MRTVMFSKARNELASLLDDVSQDRVAVEIVRRDKPSAILIDKDEYEGMMETLHLLSTPANASRLMEAIESVNAGNIELHDLIEAGRLFRIPESALMSSGQIVLGWEPDGWKQYSYWQQNDPKMVSRINELIKDALRHPFEGIGKPQPLRNQLEGQWSRRITGNTGWCIASMANARC
jgi:antitoxin YefM